MVSILFQVHCKRIWFIINQFIILGQGQSQHRFGHVNSLWYLKVQTMENHDWNALLVENIVVKTIQTMND